MRSNTILHDNVLIVLLSNLFPEQFRQLLYCRANIQYFTKYDDDDDDDDDDDYYYYY